MASISPTQSNVQQALITFLAAVLPAGIPIIAGQQNRSAEPASGTFVVVTPIRFVRLATNVDGSADVKFTGFIAATVMTVSAVQIGALAAGASVFGTGVTNPTTIVKQLTGSAGSTGTYQVSASQTVGSRTLSAGGKTMTQSAEVTVQIDFHSADFTAGDMAQTVATAFRDEYGTTFFAGLASPMNGIAPLYADDPTQRPFLDAEQQYEWRWSLDAHLQVNQIVGVPQTYADAIDVTVVSVDATFPP